ncbi:MAG TPA: acyltransferase [Pyrinomonadaceae bacterium]|nr:acyltransferase [Pyrinomonadaceae bacterium]
MQNEAFRLGYRPQLDGLRGIAILLVFLHHAGISFIHGAHIGVDIFFVLSGFLITALLCQEYEKKARVSLRNFYIRRILRLTPALALLLAVFAAYTLALKSGDALAKSGQAILYTALYLSDFALAFDLASLGSLEHTWSLAIEEHFYLLFPVALVALLRKKCSRRTILILLGVLIFAIAVHRAFLWDSTPQAVNRVFYGFDTRADGLLVGCLLGLIASWGKLPRVNWFPALPAALVLFFACVFVSWDSALYAYGLPVINLSTALVLAFVLNGNTAVSAWLGNKVLVWIGMISYGLYLWHNLIFILVRERVVASPWGVLVLGGIISFVCAALSYYLLEKPCLKLKERFTNDVAGAAQAENIDAAAAAGLKTATSGSLNA